MYTKICLLSIAFMLFFPISISIGASFQRQIIPVHAQANKVPAENTKHSGKSEDWAVDISGSTSHTTKCPTDDDCKSHNFHYTRLGRIRRRILWIIIFKIFLSVTHISALLLAYSHLVS